MKNLIVLSFTLTIFFMTNAQTVHYKLSMSKPHTHFFEVEITFPKISSSTLEVKMANWRTGRYVILDFAGAVQEFSAGDGNKNLQWRKIDKSTWKIQSNKSSVTVRYKVYANEFNLRTRELNDEHGFLDPLAVFMYAEEFKNNPIELTVHPFGNWHVTTGLDEVKNRANIFSAPNFETLGDSPLEIGAQKDFEFFVEGKKHSISMYGEGNWNIDSLKKDFTTIIVAHKKFFGNLPYEKYVFQIHCQPNAGGGTEHLNSTIMGVRPFIFNNKAAYIGFLGLTTHEFFHTWNVKQFRPKGFTPYEFSRENYSEELWVAEGATSYYTPLFMVRMQFQTSKSYLEQIANSIRSDRAQYGNRIQSLSESSFDAWIKFWKNLKNVQNSQSDYYEKGADVCMLLDLELRQRTNNARSFDDVMREMYKRFPIGKGYTTFDVQNICEEFSKTSFAEFFTNFITGTTPLPWEKILRYAGLEITASDTSSVVGLGFSTQDAGEKTRIISIYPNSPAEKAGLNINDELLAINNFRVRTNEIPDRISQFKSGEKITLAVFRNDRLREFSVTMENFSFPSYTIKKIESPSELQKAIYESWLEERWN